MRYIILRHVRPGSIIITDCWRAYGFISDVIDEDGGGSAYSHLTVNHSRYFRDPVSGAHTNTIEGTWAGLKRMIRPRNRSKDNCGDHLLEMILVP